MSRAYRTSFLILLTLFFLLPIFFIPGGIFSLEVSKSAILAFGSILAFMAFIAEYFRQGRLSLPWHPLFITVIILPVVYLASSLAVEPASLSLFGYILEPGTFGFLLIASALFTLTAFTFDSKERIVKALGAIILSLSLVAVFAAVKIFSGGGILELGIFLGNMGNPIGNWTDLAIGLGVLAILTAFAIEMLSVGKAIRVFLSGVFILSSVLLAIINFSVAFVLLLILSVLMFVYFFTAERRAREGEEETAGDKHKVISWPVAVLFGLSLLYVINPVISGGGTVGDIVGRTFSISNTDVRPSLSSTLTISRNVLSKNALLGSGPNTFGRDWLIHKPIDINTTPFWEAIFPFGIGFVPTQVASTGVIGTLVWVAFLLFFLTLGLKSMRNLPPGKTERFAIVSTFFSGLFLWLSALFYPPSAVPLMLAFIFSALFLATSGFLGVIPVRRFVFSGRPSTNLLSAILGVGLVIGAVVFGLGAFQRTSSAYHFGKALQMSNTEGVLLADLETELVKALTLFPNDVYYSALSRLHFAKASRAAQNLGDSEENTRLFLESISLSVQSARAAVQANPAGYANRVLLGSIYSVLAGQQFNIDGAYENAKVAYAEARKLNPSTPEGPLLLARLELGENNVESARSHIREAITLKEDYAEAYLLLTQLEVRENNTREAISSAEVWALLVPGNAGVFFELGLLKYSNLDYTGAGDAFFQSLQITPDYANAQYYLGLSYIQLGELGNATSLFEELNLTNPDNAEVKSILDVLRQGKNPFTNSGETSR